MNTLGLVTPYASSVLSDEETADNSRVDSERSFSTDLFDGGTDLRAIADRAISIVCKMLDAGVRARQQRFENIRKNEDMNNGNTPPALRGRSNIPFDYIVMNGFIETLMANTNEPIDLTYTAQQMRGTKAAKRMTAVWNEEMGPNKNNLDVQIGDSKLMAALSGRGFGKLNVDNVPTFGSFFYVPDHYDMVTEPQGGAYLDKHLFKFEMNIFRTRLEMIQGAKNGFYDMKQVLQLTSRYTDPEYKKNDDAYRNKMARYAAFGTDIEAEGYVGQNLYRLTEGAVSINHVWYYILFSRETETWVRFDKLENVFPWASRYPGRAAWTSWATHKHPMLFWTMAPADIVRAIGYTMKKILNLTIDNLEKRNWDMKAYDPRVFTDPEKLLYKQDALVRATLRQGQKIQDGIFSFQTPDTTNITINLMQYLDMFLGKKTGVNDEAAGAGNANIAAIQIGNIAQLSKRMTLYNQQYAAMYNDLGVMFNMGTAARLREPVGVRIVGADLADWEGIFTPDDAKENFNIQVKSGANAEREDLESKDKRSKFFQRFDNNPILGPKISAEALIRLEARDAGFKDEDIDTLLDVRNSTDADVLADAATAIQAAVENSPMKVYRDANVAFIQKITDFVVNHYQIIPTRELKKLPKNQQTQYAADMKEVDRLLAVVKVHMPFVQNNAKNEQKIMALAQGKPDPTAPQAPAQPMRVSPQMQKMLIARANGNNPNPNPGGGAPVSPGLPGALPGAGNPGAASPVVPGMPPQMGGTTIPQ